MAAYAALTSLMHILDQLERHPFPPISLDKQQVESLTEIATSLQEFLEGYNSPFVDSDEAEPLEMRIADAAYAAEDVIESYIVHNIHFAAAATHNDEVNSSSVDELNPEEETNSYEDVSSGRESICPGEEEINSHEEVINSGGESSFSGEEEINSNEATTSHDDEVISPGRVLNSEKDINSDDEDASSGDGEAINSGEEISCVDFYQDVWKVIEEMDLVNKEVMEMMREETAVKAHHQPQRNILKSSSFSGKNSSVMVGFDDLLLQLLDKLTGGPSRRQVIPITGMGGIGKTTLARNIFENALIKAHFDICSWVTISHHNTKQILCKILSQASGKSSEKRDKSEEELGDKSEEGLGVELHKYLFNRRYLIIMDDIWSIEVWEKMRFSFPDCKNGSRIVVTTRQSFLTSQLTDSNDGLPMRFLDEVNSWNLFSKTVFEEGMFPPQLEKIGKKIVKNCRGLPLSIVVIGGFLAKSQHTHEHWEHLEQKLNSIVNSENDEYCLKILKLSYNHLPAYLKPCFLYMGIFEEDTRIRVSTLIKLWVSEGFLKPENGQSLETIGEGFLKDLITRNLILVDGLGSTGNIKYCKMHDLLRDICLKQAEKERFYHVIEQHEPQDIQNHNRRRMIYPRRTSKERVLDALKSTTSHVRSFTFQSQTYDSGGMFPNFRLLRILNANEVEYCVRDVIHALVNSRYVAIDTTRWYKEIPSSVNFLWNLHTLRIGVVGLHKLIIAPVEIWKMSQLRHVEFLWPWGVMYLPDPPSGSSIVILKNLQTLKGIANFKCGEEVVKRIPNIKKLEIRYRGFIEIGRHDLDDYCLSNFGCLHKLESLNVKVFYENHDFLHNITFPPSLRKLSLETIIYSVGWEEMLEKIGGGSLPLLQKLKLEGGVFKTGKWETVEGHFPRLKFLKLSYCPGLKQWMLEESSHFPCLEHLHLVGLKELEEIPLEIGEIPTLQSIELRKCSESTVKSAKKIVEEQEELQGENTFCVRVEERTFNRKALESLESRNFQFKWENEGHVYSVLGLARLSHTKGHSNRSYEKLSSVISSYTPLGWMHQEMSLYCDGEKRWEELEKATELDPTLTYPYMYRAASLMRKQDVQSAITEINRVLGFKLALECLELRFCFYLALEDHQSALCDVQAILTLCPDYRMFGGRVAASELRILVREHVESWTTADCWLQLYDRWSLVDDIGSLSVIYQLLESDAEKGVLYFRQSLLLLRLNCPEAAMRSLQLAREHASSEPERLVYEGWILYDTGHCEEGLRKAEESISLQRSFEAFFLKAYALADSSQDPSCSSTVVSLLEEALKCPSDLLRKGQALNNLGSVYVDCGKLDAAADCYINALKIRNTRAHQGLARVHYLRNDKNAAYAEMTKLIDKVRNNAFAYEKRSEYCERDLTKADLEMVTRLDPLRVYPYRYRAAVLMDKHKENEAIAELSRAIAFKADVHLLHLRAAFYEHIGDVIGALRDCRAALSVDPNHQEMLELHSRLNI